MFLVWSSCWSMHFGITSIASSLQEAFFSLSLPHSKSSLPTVIIFSCFLLARWHQHWLTVFQDQLFSSPLILSSATRLLQQFTADMDP
ncbi:hypothetical protein BDF14DRAFT_1846572, partial [Spinellus fusiger]